MANPTSKTNGTTSTTTTLEVLSSPLLASILVPMIDEGAELLAVRYREQGESRMRDAALAAFRALGVQIEAHHDDGAGGEA